MHRSNDGDARLAKPMDEPTQLPIGEARQDTERSPRLISECIATAPESAIGALVPGLDQEPSDMAQWDRRDELVFGVMFCLR